VPDPSVHGPDLRVWSRTLTFPRMGSGPLCVRSGSPTTRSWDKEYPRLGQGCTGVRRRHLSGLRPVRSRSPLGRGPDDATWPIARDVSQRAEPDIRPLGHAISAFIAEKTHRLSTLLTGDVPSRHLMCLVHSTGKQRPDHPTGDVPVQSDSGQYARVAARATWSS
jgi:hypothetical protein